MDGDCVWVVQAVCRGDVCAVFSGGGGGGGGDETVQEVCPKWYREKVGS